MASLRDRLKADRSKQFRNSVEMAKYLENMIEITKRNYHSFEALEKHLSCMREIIAELRKPNEDTRTIR